MPSSLPMYVQLLRPFIGSWLLHTCLHPVRSMQTSSQSSQQQLFQALYQKYPEMESDVQHSGAELFAFLETHSSALQHLEYEHRQRLFQQLHLPAFVYFKHLYHKHRLLDARRPLFIGLSAPQGCGKTTMTSVICDLFRHEGISCTAMSIDDFYLTGSQQDALSKRYSHNQLLEFRGNAGTHDLQLAMSTLHALLNMRSASKAAVVRIPQYDKSLREGRGDRTDQQRWQQLSEPVDVVVLEGWLLGFNPLNSVSQAIAAATDKSYLLRLTNSSDLSCLPVDGFLDGDHQCSETSHQWTDEEEAIHWRSLKEINELLRPYEALHFMMDTWLVLAVQSPTVVYQWRAEAEQRMRARGSPGLTEQQVAAFVDRFMPAYDLYLRELYRIGPQRRRDTASSPVLKVTVAEDRFPSKVELIGS